MIKRTIYFGNPAYLHTRNDQIVIENGNNAEPIILPIEDLGTIILDHGQITLTSTLLSRLLENNVAVIACDKTHHPTGLWLNLDSHSLQQKIFSAQIEASQPLKKQLWQQTVVSKIKNQATVLKLLSKNNLFLANISKAVKSGDSENHEAQAAAYYWKNIFPSEVAFKRDRMGMPPNNLLNYGYAILRALVARCLVGSGLLPTLGIFHRNQYNAYCLADDIMEPYRPFVDWLVIQNFNHEQPAFEISKEQKQALLSIPALDVSINGQKSPLMNAVQRTTASLARCFQEKASKISYASFVLG